MTQTDLSTEVLPNQDTWTMSTTVLIQAGVMNVELHCQTMELRGEMREDCQLLGELIRNFESESAAAVGSIERSFNFDTSPIVSAATELVNSQSGIDSPYYRALIAAVQDFQQDRDARRSQLREFSTQTANQALSLLMDQLRKTVNLYSRIDINRDGVRYFVTNAPMFLFIGEDRDSYVSDSEAESIIDHFIRMFQQNLDNTDIQSFKSNFILSRQAKNALESMPIPVYGSAPKSIQSLLTTLGGSGIAGAIGLSQNQDTVTLSFYSGATAVVLFFGVPYATTLRDSSNKWLEKKLNKKFGLDKDD